MSDDEQPITETPVPAEIEIMPEAEEPAPAPTKEVAQETGMIPIKDAFIRQVRALGVQFDDAGAIQMGRGFTFITQAALATCINRLSVGIEQNALDPIKGASALAALARAMCACNTSQRLSSPLETVPPVVPDKTNKGPSRSWRAYEKVEIRQRVVTPA